ncbi:MAG: hypothetical protein ACOCOW_03610 [Prevotella sp.]
MKKQYIIPLAVRIPEGDLPSILAGTQSPWFDAKSDQFSEEEDTWEEDNPWDRVDKPRDLWE